MASVETWVARVRKEKENKLKREDSWLKTQSVNVGSEFTPRMEAGNKAISSSVVRL
jgi:hypothetical protein